MTCMFHVGMVSLRVYIRLVLIYSQVVFHLAAYNTGPGLF